VAGCVLAYAEEKCLEPDALFIELFVHFKKIIKICFMY
jgi:hypothetical protein